jgi:SAM-dependent methyltransferase
VTSKSAVRDFFTHDAEPYRQAYDEDSTRGVIFRERRTIVLNLLRAPIGRVLDIGSGPGVFTQALVERGAESCFTVDLSFEMVESARRAVPPAIRNRNLPAVSDIEHLPFSGGSFDTIVCVGVLQYLEHIGPAMCELSRSLRPRGQLVVTFPNVDAPLNRLHAAVLTVVRAAHSVARRIGAPDGSPDRLTFRPDITNRAFTVAEVVTAAAEAGMKAESTIYHSLLFPFRVPGVASIIGAWNGRVPSGVLSGPRQHWGREVIIRFVRP